MTEATPIRSGPRPAPLIEDLAHKLTVCRDGLRLAAKERKDALDHIRLYTLKADKAGEQVTLLEARRQTLRKQIADEVGQ